VVQDPLFPEADLALRRGTHVGRDDGPLYDYLRDAMDFLEPLYRRFGCELVHRTGDGYFHLLPTGDRLGRRQLSAGEMLVGQVLALLYLDPASLAQGGRVERELVLQRLQALVGAEALVRALRPQVRRYDERVAAELVRHRVSEALRRLEGLGFVELPDETAVRLRPALMRFAEPVRGLDDPARALERLVARGEVMVSDTDRTESESVDEGDPDDGDLRDEET